MRALRSTWALMMLTQTKMTPPSSAAIAAMRAAENPARPDAGRAGPGRPELGGSDLT